MDESLALEGPAYRRVLLKLSGEALGSPESGECLSLENIRGITVLQGFHRVHLGNVG